MKLKNPIEIEDRGADPSPSTNKLYSIGGILTWAGLVLATLTGTQTFTNKRITPRVGGTTSSAAPTPDADTQDLYDLTALATAPTFGAPTGTPVNGQKLIIRIKDNGSARALAWNAAYVAGGVALPTTTVLSKILTIGFMYNTANALNKWMCIASSQEA